MRAELKRLHRDFGMTVIFATPDELEALSMGEEIAVMENGRVVQRGTPDSLYETPENVYVASKIGSPHMNFYDGTVDSNGGSVTTVLGSIPVEHKGLEPNAPITLGIRPHDIRPADGADTDHSPEVTLIEPLGDVTIVSLRTDGSPLRVLLPEARASDINRGDRFPIVIDGGKVHLFRSGDGSAIPRAS